MIGSNSVAKENFATASYGCCMKSSKNLPICFRYKSELYSSKNRHNPTVRFRLSEHFLFQDIDEYYQWFFTKLKSVGRIVAMPIFARLPSVDII
jgi:hypothetical protein